MSDIDTYLVELNNLSKNLPKIVADIVARNEGKMLNMLKMRLWNTGRDASGSLITPAYTETTVDWKQQAGQRTSHVTLRDSGDFYKSMFIKVIGNELIVGATDPKTTQLISKYGVDILGLTKQEQEILIYSIIEPEIEKEIQKLPTINLE